MANNIISAVFSSSNITYTKPAYQYDYGMILKFSGIELPQAYEVHFSNTEFCGESISQIGDESGVTIPDEMFLSGAPIYAWTFLHTGEDDGETVYKTVISINKRAQPSDIEPTPVQQDVITQAIAALNVAVEQTAADVVAAGESAQAAADSAEAAGQAKDDAVEAKDKAVEAKNAAETAQGKAKDAQEAAETAQGMSKDARDASEGYSEDSEAWAVGERNGVPVPATDPTYDNNSKYWAEISRQQADKAGWAFFDIDDSTGELIVTVSENLNDDVHFEINENTGDLEVTVA